MKHANQRWSPRDRVVALRYADESIAEWRMVFREKCANILCRKYDCIIPRNNCRNNGRILLHRFRPTHGKTILQYPATVEIMTGY